MAGLFQKDIRLILQNKQAILLFAFLAVFFCFTQQSTFVISYLAFLCTILTISTINYDENDNGYAFLMTLPVSYKEYVYEKYLFCIMGGLLSWGFSTALCFIANIIKDIPLQLGEELMEVLPLIPAFAIIASIFIPFQLKFGGEKSRIAMVGLCGGVVAIFFLADKVMEKTNISINGFVSKLNSMPYAVIVLILFAVAAGIMAASIGCSLAIMKKKEY